MSVNYTPPMKGYSGQGAFRFWCQTVLPIVYDDSLSYYELLNKVVVYLNNTIQDVANVEDNVAALLNAYNELQDYVNDYFTDLNIQHQIDDKIDRMVESGAFGDALSPDVQLYVQENIGGVVEDQIGSVVANQIGGVVADQIGETVEGQIGSVVASQIGEVVGDQIDASVAGQIDAVVAEQIDNSVAGQIETPVGEAVTGWLSENVDPVGSAVVVDGTLTISGAAADSQAAGKIVANNPTHIYDTTGTYSYTYPNTVFYNGKLYICESTAAVSGSFDPSKWSEIGLLEHIGHVDSFELLAPLYSFTTTYSVGDIVRGDFASYGLRRLYRCVVDIATPESFNSSHWEAITIGDVIGTQGAITNAQIDALFV